MAQAQSKDLITYIDNQLSMRADKLSALLGGSGIRPEKFKLMAIQQLVKKPEIQRAAGENPGSFISAVMTCAEQGLDFSKPNEAHLVPIPGNSERGAKGTVELFRGYKGIAKMAKRNPKVADIDVQVVRKNDKYLRRLGSTRQLIHEPPAFGQDRGEVIGFYALAHMKGAAPIWDEMSAEEVEKHAKRFIKANKGPFAGVKNHGRKDENFEAYGLKTVLIRLCYRKLDLSSELGESMQQEFEAEEVAASPSDVIDAEVVDLNDELTKRKEQMKAAQQQEDLSTGDAVEDGSDPEVVASQEARGS